MQFAPDGNFPPSIRDASSLDFRNVNIDVIANTVAPCNGTANRYAWWVAGDDSGCKAPAKNFANEYAHEPPPPGGTGDLSSTRLPPI